MQEGGRRAVCVWHRRAGKDKTLLNIMIWKMLERVGIYYYFLPTYAQGRKIIWEGIDKEGFKFLHHFPKDIVASKNDQEMRIELTNGSLFRVVGTDKIDTVVGTNPVGCVFSEYALQNPQGWNFVRPILRENEGWAIFNFTPRGKNHGWDIWQVAQAEKDWYAQMLTVEDTYVGVGKGRKRVMPPDAITKERAEGMEEELIQQEYFCSFSAALQGTYYGDQLKRMEETNRLCDIQIEKGIPVHTAWDLGIDDLTAVIFFQLIGKEIRIVDYEEGSGEGLSYYAQLLMDKRDKYGFTYGTHYMPHDVSVRELTSGRSRKEIAEDDLGILPIVAAPKLRVEDGIQAVRSIFPRIWVHKREEDEERSNRVSLLTDALQQYHKEYDEERRTFKRQPYHDWSSHAADALRTLATSFEEEYIVDEDDEERPQSYGGSLA
jgi:hypothetical protein